MQWSGVAGNGWKQSPFGRNLLTEAEMEEAQSVWERDDERSSLFREVMLLLSMEEWEHAGRSELFQLAKAIVEQEEWEESADRSELFQKLCRDSVYPMADAVLISDDGSARSSSPEADHLPLPPLWSRSELKVKGAVFSAGLAPLTSIVVEEAPLSVAVSPQVQPRDVCSDSVDKSGKTWSPNNVASMFEAWSLPPSLDLGAT